MVFFSFKIHSREDILLSKFIVFTDVVTWGFCSKEHSYYIKYNKTMIGVASSHAETEFYPSCVLKKFCYSSLAWQIER